MSIWRCVKQIALGCAFVWRVKCGQTSKRLLPRRMRPSAPSLLWRLGQRLTSQLYKSLWICRRPCAVLVPRQVCALSCLDRLRSGCAVESSTWCSREDFRSSFVCLRWLECPTLKANIKMTRLLLLRCADIFAHFNVDGWTALHSACHGGHDHMARLLLEEVSKSACKRFFCFKMLHKIFRFLCQPSLYGLFRYLKAYACPENTVHEGWTLLHVIVLLSHAKHLGSKPRSFLGWLTCGFTLKA